MANEELKVFRPSWIEPEEMAKLGYALVSDKYGYLKYQSSHALGCKCPGYGLLPNGKRIIYINTTYQPDKELVYVGIREDGDTRNAYMGVAKTEEFFKELLISVR